MKERRFFEVKDVFFLLVIFALLLIPLFTSLTKTDTCVAVISDENGTVATLQLDGSDDGVHTFDALPNMTFEVADGAVRVAESDCADKVCEHTGWISRSGASIVCLPRKVTVEVVSNTGDDIIIAG